MGERVTCSFEAYRRLESSGVLDRIHERYGDVSSFMLYGSLHVEPVGGVIFENAENVYFDRNRGISEASVMAGDVLNLEKELEDVYDIEKDNLFYEYPAFLSKVVLDDDVDYKSKGFNSLADLYRAVVAYCVDSRFEIGRTNQDNYIWRNEKFKNNIHLNVHGDFFVHQDDISSKLERTLFGEKFDVAKSSDFGFGMSSYQDSSSFLFAVLKYAEHVGMKDIPEIVDWKKTLDDVGSIGTATTECLMGGGRLGFGFFERELAVEDSKERGYPILFNGMASGNYTVPFVSKEGDFCIKSYNSEDVITGDGPRLSFGAEDVADLLKGTYRLFTRDKSLMPKILEGFLGH
jgi:hypothetical protein